MKLEKISTQIEHIYLDPNNPRFAEISDDALNIDKSRFTEAAIQQAAYEKMINPRFEVTTLSSSIATVGFVPVDNIVVARLNAVDFYVIEGNRRITAIKYLIKQYDLGQTMLSSDQIERLKNMDVLVVDDVENQNQLVGMIIQGIRNVSGIKEWDAYQKAQFINEMIEKGKGPGEISKTIGMQVKDINRYYKVFSVMLQFKNDEEYAGKWKPSYFSHFDEILKKPSLRKHFEFDEALIKFKNVENLRRFFEWIIPDENGAVAISDAHSVRKLSDLVNEEQALNYLDDKNLDKAVLFVNQKNFNQQKATANECLEKIKSAIGAFKNMVAEGLEKDLTEDDINELRSGIDDMQNQYSRVLKLRENA